MVLDRNPGQLLGSSDQPDAVFDKILEPSFTDAYPEYPDRLALVTAEFELYLTDRLGVAKGDAAFAAQRALQGFLAATAYAPDKDESDKIRVMASEFINRVRP